VTSRAGKACYTQVTLNTSDTRLGIWAVEFPDADYGGNRKTIIFSKETTHQEEKQKQLLLNLYEYPGLVG
jgi:hypothetical protein